MSQQYNVAVLGATGLVGRTAIDILEKRAFPVRQLYPLASMRSKGMTVSFQQQRLSVIDVADFDFSKVNIAIFSAGTEISKLYAPIATKAGCIVIDNTTAFRYDDDVPLIVPEVNLEAISAYRKRNIIANPNCSTVQLVVALKPIYDAVGITEINMVSYQSVSGAGKEGVDELLSQTTQYLAGESTIPTVFSASIAFNVIPFIDAVSDDNFSKEEMKVVLETRKIFRDPTLRINPTAVRVPVLYGHSEAVAIRTKQYISPEDAKHLLMNAKGIQVIDDPEALQFPMPLIQGTGTDDVYVGRIRKHLCDENGLNLWIVADNVRKGAALNAVQIAEHLISGENM